MFTAETLSRIIRIALSPITATKHQLWSERAETILIMAAAHESKMGKYLRQLVRNSAGELVPEGQACGVFQVEIGTMEDNYTNFINARKPLAKQIAEITGCNWPSVDHLTWNPLYGAIHARLKLYRSPGEIPSDTPMMAEYLKQYYNSPGRCGNSERLPCCLLRGPGKVKLTHHCCRCKRIMLASGEWLPELLIVVIGVKPSHGFCPECKAVMLAGTRQRKALRMVA